MPVRTDDGNFQVVPIPKMSKANFEFFKKPLDAYEEVIVRQTSPEPKGDSDKTATN